MRVIRALVTAQARSAWNRALAESGLAGPLATGLTIGLVALVLLVPAAMTFAAGRSLGRGLTGADPSEALLLLCSLQALVTVGFALLGGFRHRLAFTRRQLGAFPIGVASFVAAEIPAGAFEVFPLLGLTGIAASNLGLATALPASSPLILVLALQGALSLLLLQHLAGSVKRLLLKRPGAGLAAAAALGVGLAGWLGAAGGDAGRVLRAAVVGAIPMLPGSFGYAGLVDLAAGRLGAGLGRWMLMATGVCLLAMVTVWTHGREWRTEVGGWSRRRAEPALLSFRRPATGIARLHQRQVLSTRQGWVLLLIPSLMSLCLVMVVTATRSLVGRGEELPAGILSAASRLEQLPLVEVALLLALWTTAELWTNHFGWDGRGLQSLLTLPVSVRDLLLGKMLGVLGLLAAAGMLSVLPVAWTSRPSLFEVAAGLAAAAAGAIVLTTGGLVLAIRFPRAQSRTVSRATPIWLGWIPGVAMVLVVTLVVIVHRLCAPFGPWAAPIAFTASAFATAAGVRRAPRFLEPLFDAHRERLLGR